MTRTKRVSTGTGKILLALELLHACGEVEWVSVVDLQRHTNAHTSTLNTTLERLHLKGVINRVKQNPPKPSLYQLPGYTADYFLKTALKRLVDSYFLGDGARAKSLLLKVYKD